MLSSIPIDSAVHVSLQCESLSQIPDGVMYADLGHNTPSAAVSPPDIDDNVQYSLLAHDQRMAKQILDSAGMTS